MFKKLFAVATAAIVLAGCAKDVASVGSASSELKPISFSAYTQGQTRADVDGSNLTSINVLANYTPEGGTEASKYFNESIALTSSAGESTKYWPASGSMDFYASNLAVNDNGVVTVTSINNDVVVAKIEGVSCPNSNSPVTLTFSHIFAKLTVKAKVANAALYAKINKITVTSKAPASYDFTKASGNLTLDSAAATDVEYLSTETAAINEASEFASVTLAKEYIAPQSVTVKIYYTVANSDGTIKYSDHSSANPESINITATEGKNHIINLTFDANKIAFSTSVTAFSDDSGTEVVVK